MNWVPSFTSCMSVIRPCHSASRQAGERLEVEDGRETHTGHAKIRRSTQKYEFLVWRGQICYGRVYCKLTVSFQKYKKNVCFYYFQIKFPCLFVFSLIYYFMLLWLKTKHYIIMVREQVYHQCWFANGIKHPRSQMCMHLCRSWVLLFLTVKKFESFKCEA